MGFQETEKFIFTDRVVKVSDFLAGEHRLRIIISPLGESRKEERMPKKRNKKNTAVRRTEKQQDVTANRNYKDTVFRML